MRVEHEDHENWCTASQADDIVPKRHRNEPLRKIEYTESGMNNASHSLKIAH